VDARRSPISLTISGRLMTASYTRAILAVSAGVMKGGSITVRSGNLFG
jgi:hypothetical protein